MSGILYIDTVFDASACLRDDYDVSTVDRIGIRPGLAITAEQGAALVKLRARIRKRDGHSFKAQAVRTVTVGDLSKYSDRIVPHQVKRLATGEYACSCGRQWDADEGDECPGVEV